MLLRDVIVDRQRCDVRFANSIDAMRSPGELEPLPDEEVLDGCGHRLIPGLHDHHLHLLAMAAAFSSTDVSAGLGQLAHHARDPGERWIRAVGYHESSGPISRELLDELVPDRPVRVQHRSGAAWFLNTAALQELDLEQRFPDGVLMRADDLLEPLAQPPDLGAVGRALAAYGITGVTDATPDLTDSSRRLIAVAGETGELPQRVHYLSPGKLILSDHELPTLDELCTRIAALHDDGVAVALHCVTRESLALAIAALADVGVLRGDRIEHGALIDEETTRTLASLGGLGVAVVTQPGFIADRGERYLRELPASDHPDLYRYCSLLEAGTCTVPSSDAPFGPLDPWLIMRTATARTDLPTERVPFETVLDGYLRPLENVHQPARSLLVGAPADILLTDGEGALATWIGGRRVHAASAGGPAPGWPLSG